MERILLPPNGLAPICMRDETPADLPFLEMLYGSTRAEELNWVPWDAAQRAIFIRQQFQAQTRHFRLNYPDAAFQVIVDGTRPIGRLYVERRSAEILLLDIALIPEFRGLGVGTGLVTRLLAEAETQRKPLFLHVEAFNPAQRLYRRMGFELVEDKGVYLQMVWRPASSGPQSPGNHPADGEDNDSGE